MKILAAIFLFVALWGSQLIIAKMIAYSKTGKGFDLTFEGILFAGGWALFYYASH